MPVRTVSQKFIRFKWGKVLKELWGRPTKIADFGSSFWQIPNTSHVSLLEDKIQGWGMYLFTISYGSRCNGSRKWSWLIQWMNWDLRHLLVVFQCRILKYLMRGLLQHWTKFFIILTSKEGSVWRNKKAQKEDRSLRGRQVAYFIYEYFRVTGANDSVENYADLFTSALRNDDIQEFDSKWDGIFFITDENPTWWHLGKFVQIKNTSVSETQDRILDSWKERNIEHNLRMKNFEARNFFFFCTSAVVNNHGMKQREQRSLGDCWQWKANEQCP